MMRIFSFLSQEPLNRGPPAGSKKAVSWGRPWVRHWEAATGDQEIKERKKKREKGEGGFYAAI
jgi:hypothetical protein